MYKDSAAVTTQVLGAGVVLAVPVGAIELIGEGRACSVGETSTAFRSIESRSDPLQAKEDRARKTAISNILFIMSPCNFTRVACSTRRMEHSANRSYFMACR